MKLKKPILNKNFFIGSLAIVALALLLQYLTLVRVSNKKPIIQRGQPIEQEETTQFTVKEIVDGGGKD